MSRDAELKKTLDRQRREYDGFEEFGGLYRISNTRPTFRGSLPAGVYELIQDRQTGEIFFQIASCNYDQLLDIPSGVYNYVVNELERFLTPETKARFDQMGFLYKRSALLYGVPGTGKTCIVNRVAEKVVSEGGVVLFNPDPRLLKRVLPILDDIQPKTITMVIFEELDQLVANYESELLHILDGEVQKANMIYMATTNFINKVPARIMRPGRFSTVIEVPFPDEVARRFYLNHKLAGTDADIENWVKVSEGLSIDELKETVLSVFCLEQSLENSVKRMKDLKELAKKRREIFVKQEDDYEEYDDEIL